MDFSQDEIQISKELDAFSAVTITTTLGKAI